MICKNCQKEIAADSKFCEFCGLEIKKSNHISNLELKKILSNKDSFLFWLLFIATVLLIITAFNLITWRGNFSSEWKTEDIYMLLRIYIFCVSAYIAFLNYKNKKINIAFLFAVMSIVLNPFKLFNFTDDTVLGWLIVFSAAFFGYFAYKEYKRIIVNKNENSLDS